MNIVDMYEMLSDISTKDEDDIVEYLFQIYQSYLYI